MSVIRYVDQDRLTIAHGWHQRVAECYTLSLLPYIAQQVEEADWPTVEHLLLYCILFPASTSSEKENIRKG